MKTLVGNPERKYNYRDVPLWALPQIRAIVDHWAGTDLVVLSFTTAKSLSHGYLTVYWPKPAGTARGELFKENMNDPTTAIRQFKLTSEAITWVNE